MLILECTRQSGLVDYTARVDEQYLWGRIAASPTGSWYGAWHTPAGHITLIHDRQVARAPAATILVPDPLTLDEKIGRVRADLSRTGSVIVDGREFRVIDPATVPGLAEHLAFALDSIASRESTDWDGDGLARIAPTDVPADYAVHVEWGPPDGPLWVSPLAVIDGPEGVTLQVALHWARRWARVADIRHADRPPERIDLR